MPRSQPRKKTEEEWKKRAWTVGAWPPKPKGIDKSRMRGPVVAEKWYGPAKIGIIETLPSPGGYSSLRYSVRKQYRVGLPTKPVGPIATGTRGPYRWYAYPKVLRNPAPRSGVSRAGRGRKASRREVEYRWSR